MEKRDGAAKFSGGQFNFDMLIGQQKLKSNNNSDTVYEQNSINSKHGCQIVKKEYIVFCTGNAEMCDNETDRHQDVPLPGSVSPGEHDPQVAGRGVDGGLREGLGGEGAVSPHLNPNGKQNVSLAFFEIFFRVD